MEEDDSIRFSRQIMMKEVGADGQERLGKASVLIAGLGGLGSISAYYLVAAGVGRLVIVDRDRVELSNLNRQLLHHTQDLGLEKTASALTKLKALNPRCVIEAHFRELDAEHARQIAHGCDVIVDGTDNLAARHILNGTSLGLGIPFVHGAVGGLNGMVTTFVPGKGPCLECLFPGSTDEGERPGILGPVAGLIASIQALESIRIVLGHGSGLRGRLLYFRGSDMNWKEIRIERNPHCKACSG